MAIYRITNNVRLLLSIPAPEQELLWSAVEGANVVYHVVTLTWVKGDGWNGPQLILGPLRAILAIQARRNTDRPAEPSPADPNETETDEKTAH